MIVKRKVAAKEHIVAFLLENTGYKIVALCVSLVLWITILGRKNMVQTHEVNLQMLLPPNHTIANEVERKAKIKMSGPRMGLKKFIQSEDSLTLDLSKLPPGVSKIHVGEEGLNLPLGVKVLEITPKEIKIKIIENKLDEKNGISNEE